MKTLVLFATIAYFPLVLAQQGKLHLGSAKKVWEQPIKAENYYFVGVNNGTICRHRADIGFDPITKFYAKKDYHLEVWQIKSKQEQTKKYKGGETVTQLKPNPSLYVFKLKFFRVDKYGNKAKVASQTVRSSFSIKRRMEMFEWCKGLPGYVKKYDYKPTLKPQSITNTTGSIIPFVKLMKEVYAVHIYNSVNKEEIIKLPINRLFFLYKWNFLNLEN